jgi:hypothetical protein
VRTVVRQEGHSKLRARQTPKGEQGVQRALPTVHGRDVAPVRRASGVLPDGPALEKAAVDPVFEVIERDAVDTDSAALSMKGRRAAGPGLPMVLPTDAGGHDLLLVAPRGKQIPSPSVVSVETRAARVQRDSYYRGSRGV